MKQNNARDIASRTKIYYVYERTASLTKDDFYVCLQTFVFSSFILSATFSLFSWCDIIKTKRKAPYNNITKLTIPKALNAYWSFPFCESWTNLSIGIIEYEKSTAILGNVFEVFGFQLNIAERNFAEYVFFLLLCAMRIHYRIVLFQIQKRKLATTMITLNYLKYFHEATIRTRLRKAKYNRVTTCRRWLFAEHYFRCYSNANSYFVKLWCTGACE